MTPMGLGTQLIWLVVLALPVACIAWTVCEFCFSHWVTAFFLVLTRYTRLVEGWRGYLIAEFALAWIANMYMSLFARMRLDIKLEHVEIAEQETRVPAATAAPGGGPGRTAR